MQGLFRYSPSNGLGVEVEARLARMSYGVKNSPTFVERVHDERDKYWCPVNEEYRAADQFEWFLEAVRKQGRPFGNSSLTRFPGRRHLGEEVSRS